MAGVKPTVIFNLIGWAHVVLRCLLGLWSALKMKRSLIASSYFVSVQYNAPLHNTNR